MTGLCAGSAKILADLLVGEYGGRHLLSILEWHRMAPFDEPILTVYPCHAPDAQGRCGPVVMWCGVGMNKEDMVKTLIILNEPAYGNERSYNGLRLGRSLATTGETELRVFLMGDAVTVAMSGQKTPDGYYDLEVMLRALSSRDVPIACCGTCIDARGIAEESLTEGASRSSMTELTAWALWADKVLTF